MIGIHTCAVDPKKIVGRFLPPCEARSVDEPQTSVFQANLESSMIVCRWDDSRQPLVDFVWKNDEFESQVMRFQFTSFYFFVCIIPNGQKLKGIVIETLTLTYKLYRGVCFD